MNTMYVDCVYCLLAGLLLLLSSDYSSKAQGRLEGLGLCWHPVHSLDYGLNYTHLVQNSKTNYILHLDQRVFTNTSYARF